MIDLCLKICKHNLKKSFEFQKVLLISLEILKIEKFT